LQHQKLHDWHLALGTWHLAPNGTVRPSLDVSIWHTADGRSAVPLVDFGDGRSWVVEAKPTKVLLLTLMRMRWASRVARVGRMEVCTGKSEEKNHLEALGSFGRIILKWLSNKRNGGRRVD